MGRHRARSILATRVATQPRLSSAFRKNEERLQNLSAKPSEIAQRQLRVTLTRMKTPELDY